MRRLSLRLRRYSAHFAIQRCCWIDIVQRIGVELVLRHLLALDEFAQITERTSVAVDGKGGMLLALLVSAAVEYYAYKILLLRRVFGELPVRESGFKHTFSA